MIRRSSFVGQMAIVMAVALLLAQSVNFMLLLQARERLQTEREDRLIERYVGNIQNASERPFIRERMRRRSPPPIRFTNQPVAGAGERDERMTERLQQALVEAGLEGEGAVVARMPHPLQSERGPVLVMSSKTSDDQWINYTLPAPRQSHLSIRPLIIQTVVLYIGLMIAVLMVTARLSRPLRELTKAADDFTLDGSHTKLNIDGPSDIRSLTNSLEKMQERITRLFNQKDMMLGAIGHDLRTPLTSLRIRTEQVQDEQLRVRMIGTIDELSVLLEDILVLARDGRSHASPQKTDISLLVHEIVDSFAVSGAEVTLTEYDQIELSVHAAMLRRALRNLIENGLRYGEIVRVALKANDHAVLISIEDEGPGVPEEELVFLREPFRRGESSRNRETGGAGLGLAIADAAMRAHDGTLELSNRPEGGVRAVLKFPQDPS